MARRDDYSKLLANASIFSALSQDQLLNLAACLKSIHHTRNATIFSEEAEGQGMYFVKSGRCKAVLHNDSGRETILCTFREGDFFGEMSLLDGKPRSAAVVATENVELLCLSREDFVAQLCKTPQMALRIMSELSQRLRRSTAVIGNLTLLDVYGRVAHTLKELAEDEGESCDEGIKIDERPTQQDLAAMIGTTRETVSRVLSEFQRRGLLNVHGKTIILSHAFVEGEAEEFRNT